MRSFRNYETLMSRRKVARLILHERVRKGALGLDTETVSTRKTPPPATPPRRVFSSPTFTGTVAIRFNFAASSNDDRDLNLQNATREYRWNFVVVFVVVVVFGDAGSRESVGVDFVAIAERFDEPTSRIAWASRCGFTSRHGGWKSASVLGVFYRVARSATFLVAD